MEAIKIKTELRTEKSTKKRLSDLRAARKIPAVIYGGKEGSLPIIIDEKELFTSLKAAGGNAILTLQHSKGEDTVILKDLQRHVVTGTPIHADFHRVVMTEKIDVEVPLETVGEAPGVKLGGGVLEQPLRELEVRCLPNAIPQEITVDVSALEMGGSITVKDLKVPGDVEILADPDTIVLHILHVRVEAAPEPEAGEVAEGAQPEVIAKGKEKDGEEAKPGEAKAEGDKDAGKKDAGKKEGK